MLLRSFGHGTKKMRNIYQDTDYNYRCWICPKRDGMIEYTNCIFEYFDHDNGRMVAHLEAFVYENEIYLSDLFVTPYERRKHLATKLIDHAMEFRENQTIHLECYADDYPALALYRKLGFEIDGECENRGDNLYHMVKK